MDFCSFLHVMSAGIWISSRGCFDVPAWYCIIAGKTCQKNMEKTSEKQSFKTRTAGCFVFRILQYDPYGE